MDSSGLVQIGTGTLVGGLIAIFGMFAAVIGIFTRIILRSTNSNVNGQLEVFKENVDQKIESIKESRIDCRTRHTLVQDKLELEFKELRDKWTVVLEKNTILEATQTEKVKSLFRSVDDMHVALRDLKPALQRKVENMMRNITDDLRRNMREYVREEARKILSEEGAKRGRKT